jgi:hypothetical protein
MVACIEGETSLTFNVEALRKQPRYVLTPEQEQAVLTAWKARTAQE